MLCREWCSDLSVEDILDANDGTFKNLLNLLSPPLSESQSQILDGNGDHASKFPTSILAVG